MRHLGLLTRILGRTIPSLQFFVRTVPMLLAAAGTLTAAAGLVGLALAAWTGEGRSPYDPCGPRSRNAYCQAIAHPTAVTPSPIP